MKSRHKSWVELAAGQAELEAERQAEYDLEMAAGQAELEAERLLWKTYQKAVREWLEMERRHAKKMQKSCMNDVEKWCVCREENGNEGR